jgi:hypothetical protein
MGTGIALPNSRVKLLLRMESPSGAALADSAGSGITFDLPTGAVVPHPASLNAPVAVISKALSFSSTDSWMKSSSVIPAGLITTLLGEWTITSWFRPNSLHTGAIIQFGNVNSSEAEADNVLGRLCLFDTGRFETYWEGTAGIDLVGANTVGPLYDVGTWNLGMVRKRSNGAGQFFVDYGLNGYVVQTRGPFDNATGGSNARAYVGRDQDGSAYYSGLLDETALWGDPITDAEFLDLYDAGIGGVNVLCDLPLGDAVVEVVASDGLTEAASTSKVGAPRNGFNVGFN